MAHYVNNADFLKALIEYRALKEQAQKEGKPKPIVSNYIGECILKIATKLSTKPCFMNYSYREEMISDGIENCFLYFKDYNPSIGQNPFAYFTQVIYYAFLRRISKEEKNRYIIYKNFQEMMTTHDTNLLTDSSDKHLLPTQVYDNINSFMDKFERKEEEKKEKRKNIKTGLQKFYEE